MLRPPVFVQWAVSVNPFCSLRGWISSNSARIASQAASKFSGSSPSGSPIERRSLTPNLCSASTPSATRTAHSLGELQQRLQAIDKAQTNIEKLSGDVLTLQDILSNKQTRGAFGEIQLQEIVSHALPPDAYSFQHTLSNGRRADCLLGHLHRLLPLGGGSGALAALALR